MPDYATRLKYLEVVLKLKGDLIEKRELTGQLSIPEILGRARELKDVGEA
jgi:hypothetical protein